MEWSEVRKGSRDRPVVSALWFARPCADRAFSWRLGDRLSRGIAERKEHAPGPCGFVPGQLVERFPERFEPEIGIAFSAVESVEECGDLDELASRVHEIEVEEFLAVHWGKRTPPRLR